MSTLITKAKWTKNNKTFAVSGSTLKAMAVDNAKFNYNKVLNGTYDVFGITNNAMQDERSIVQKYGNAIVKVARTVGVDFDKDSGISSKDIKKSKGLVMPTMEEFEALLIEALTPKDKAPKAYDFYALLAQFTKKASEEGYTAQADTILQAMEALNKNAET